MRITLDTIQSQIADLLRGPLRTRAGADTPAAQFDAMPSAVSAVASGALSPDALRVVMLLQELLQLPAPQAQQLRPLAQVMQQMPQLFNELFKLFTALNIGQADSSTMTHTAELLGRLAYQTQAAAAALPPGQQDLAAQHTRQWMQQIRALIESQPNMPAPARATPAELMNFLANALRERPATFENELFALPVHQAAGISLPVYQRIANDVEPIRVALLLIAAKRAPLTSGEDGAPPLTQLLGALRTTLQASQSVLPVIEKWEALLRPTQPKTNSAADTAPVSRGAIALFEAFAEVPLGAPRALQAQALSNRSGVLPDTAWSVEPNPGDIALQGSLLYTMMYPAGLQRLRLRVRDDETDDESLVEFLLFVVRGLTEEDEDDEDDLTDEERAKKNRAKKKSAPAVVPQIVPTPDAPLVGRIEVNFSAPYILTHPYDPHAVVPAPLHVAFHFLTQLVHPATRLSRDRFLSLPQSPVACRFRRAVHRLAREGLGAYDEYARSVESLFEHLQPPAALAQSWETAQTFLQEEVLRYLSGAHEPSPPRSQYFAETCAHGDVMASLCATSAGLLAQSQQPSDALIHLADAATLAHTKPGLLTTLGKFLYTLRGTLAAAPPPSAVPPLALATSLPILATQPVAGNDTAADRLANLFVDRVCPVEP